MTKTPLTVVLLFFLLIISAVVPPSTAEIKSLVISSDARPMILFEKFGFTHTGHVTVSVSSVSVVSTSPDPNPDPSRLGFFLLSEESLLQVLLEIQQNARFCVLDSHYVTHLFTFRDLSPPPNSRFNHSYPVTSPNEYSLFFANCAPETKVSMAVRTEMYNKDPNGSKDYLPAGSTQLPSLYSFFFLCYATFLGYWGYTCYTNKRVVHRIHLLMAGLLLIKSLNLICAAEDKHYVKITGTPHGWDILFYIFQFIRVVLLFTVIILIGTGWSFLKPFLQEKEKNVLMIVIPLQVLANIASIVIGETGPFIKDWVTWNQVFLLVDIICCCAIIFPIVWSIRALRETSKTDGKAARNLSKLTLFRQFYIVVIGYLYFTRIVVFALKTIAAYKYQWVSFAAEEIVSLVFYVIMFYMFRPEEKNEYFAVAGDYFSSETDPNISKNKIKMSSLVERLRLRSDRKPVYNLDESDDEDYAPKKDRTFEQVEAIVRTDAKENACQACGESANLVSCNTCTYAYHAKCLIPPLKDASVENWRCPECVSPLSEMDKILDCEMRPTISDEQDSSDAAPKPVSVKQYLVKWKGLSYLHCSWVPEKEFVKAYKTNHRLKTRVNNFHRQKLESSNNNEDDFVAIRPEWTTVDRILAYREEDGEEQYLVKYKELSYDECYWESESDISTFQNEIQRFKDINSRTRRGNKDVDHRRNPKDFQQFDHSPEFLKGLLHPYQLEGLNFLRFSWSKQTHVILADEMGLGKTIQSIALLASLFEENLIPHLVIAPLSTLRNWEREFATWAPQMNVVMYFGTSQARAVIREHEFYFPKGQQKMKKKKSGQSSSENKQKRIKFDVLLTSYEMINLDTAVLKPIKWECMIVDEGHRLKNKDSKLFSSLTQYSSNHRILLTGTPLQNNLDELFMLMHFLDAGKFGSLEEFQEEFKDINQEEQISRLHRMLAPHLLRRVKKDVMKDMPPKKELILRVDLSSEQKEYYKAILSRNYQVLTKKGGAQISLNNIMMELRKVCCHPYMLEGVEPVIHDANEAFKKLVESCGKLQLLDKMMVKLKEQGHRVLIYTQFQHMLDLLEDYCSYKEWSYERIDGKVGGAERQIRIDRFNAVNSSRFCFLLSTRAGGLGINLATADTVIIYDSDWNPHADLQAMARAHRLGQRNKVMIYRLINRGTIEERMMQLTKKKMVLEHLVVGKLKTQNINQEELDDIIRYGSKELFASEDDEAGKSGKIHYDDAAIDKLLDRDIVDAEEVAVDDEEENGFLKAFKVANFEYIDENEAAALEAQRVAAEKKSSAGERATYWEELLKDKFEVQQAEELNALGKRKRSRKQLVSVEEDDLAGLEDVSSDGDESYEADSTDGETPGQGNQTGRRPYRRKGRDNSEPTPLMEGEGRSFRVLGFNQSQRAIFVQTLMRFGVGNYDWKEFVPRLKQKTYDEIKEYGVLFLKHIAEDIDENSSTFSDGVPKEGLRIEDVLVRIAVLMLVQEKVKLVEDHPGKPVFPNRILERFPGLRSGKVWKEEHDKIMIRAVLKHGYGRWQAIVDDKGLGIQELICKELNFPHISLSAAEQAGLQGQNGSGSSNLGAQNHGGGVTGNSNASPADAGQVNSMFYYRDMQRRLVEFVKKRVLLLEKALNYEYAEDYYGLGGSSSVPSEEPEAEPKVTDTVGASFIEVDDEMLQALPKTEPITSEEIMVAAADNNQERVEIAQLYNKMCKDLDENARESVQAYVNNQPSNGKLGESFRSIESNISRILSAPSDQLKSTEDTKPNLNNVEMDSVEETKPLRASVDLNVLEGEENIGEGSGSVDVKMEEAK